METNKNGSPIIKLLIALVLIIGIYVLVLNNKKEEVIVDNNPPAETDTTKTFTSTAHRFSIKYPADFTFEESNSGGFYNEINLYSVALGMPKSYQADTDFNLGRITVSVSPTTTLCYSSNGQTQDMTATKQINGKTFHYNPAGPQGDAAMGGQRGTTFILSTIANDKCYRVQEEIGYRDLRGFAEPPYPAHFNEAKVNADLDAIIATLTIQ
jgi:hypothetical protein